MCEQAVCLEGRVLMPSRFQDTAGVNPALLMGVSHLILSHFSCVRSERASTPHATRHEPLAVLEIEVESRGVPLDRPLDSGLLKHYVGGAQWAPALQPVGW